MNLGELQGRAQALRQRPLTADTRAALEVLRNDALGAGPAVAAALDRHLQALFVDVYGGRAPPPVAVTNAGPARGAQGLTHGGARGSALQFFALQAAPGSAPPHTAGALAAQSPAQRAAQITARLPTLQTTTPLPVPLATQFPPLSPTEQQAARRAIEAELSSVRTRGGGDLLGKLQQRPGLSAAQKERVLDVLAAVKAGYARVGAALAGKPGGAAYQDVNWKHTRLELDRVLDVATAMKLSPAETETALLASFVSDAVKTPANFLVHNVHGAQAAVHLLARLSPAPTTDLIEDVVKATLEHQIGPPGFMANVALRNALKGAGVDGALVASITAKVASPLDPAHQTADRTQLSFSRDEAAALAKVGVAAWTVPHEGSRHHRASRAVIDADSLVNYACPDGWAKLAALHGPDQPVFLQEPRLVDGLLSERPEHASALKSYRDALGVVSDDSRALYTGGLQRTKQARERVQKELERWVSGQPPRSVPRTKDGKVPYLDGALDYGNATQVAFARRLRDEAVRLLRQQEAL
ncbi:MAG: hypothetical protein FJ137_04785 [Deltaproteobacteria bacterium]|nr:hypothetical protein [Deltaproteobacteria bacterium]